METTTISPLERAARAVREAQGCGLTVEGALSFCDDKRSVHAGHCDCHNIARAVLQAIREPSEGMVAAAWVARQACPEGSPPGVVFNHAWIEMIDAALTEQPPRRIPER